MGMSLLTGIQMAFASNTVGQGRWKTIRYQHQALANPCVVPLCPTNAAPRFGAEAGPCLAAALCIFLPKFLMWFFWTPTTTRPAELSFFAQLSDLANPDLPKFQPTFHN